MENGPYETEESKKPELLISDDLVSDLEEFKVKKRKELAEEFFEFLRVREYGIMKFQIQAKHPNGKIDVDIRILKHGELDNLIETFSKK